MRWLAILAVLAACGGPSKPKSNPKPEPTLEPTATVEPAPGATSGLTRDHVDRTVKSAKDRILACYQREVNAGQDIAGKLVVAFTINAEGYVTDARIDEGSNLDSPNVEDCVIGEIRILLFPPEGGAVVRYPFIFSHG